MAYDSDDVRDFCEQIFADVAEATDWRVMDVLCERRSRLLRAGAERARQAWVRRVARMAADPEYREQYRERYNEYNRKWYASLPESRREQIRERARRRYWDHREEILERLANKTKCT
jgi:hypothetical protein